MNTETPIEIAGQSFGVGHLNAGQVASLLEVKKLAEPLLAGGSAAEISPDLIRAVAAAMASILISKSQTPGASQDCEAFLLSLPLDGFIEAVRAVFVAVMAVNADFLTERVVPALEALSVVIGGLDRKCT